MTPDRQSIFDLIRLPAALSVPGDILVGASTRDNRHLAGAAGTATLITSSCALYWAGMALNDYADREIDAVERPNRPIPSGRVSPQFALRLAQGLTVGGIALATVGGGKRGFSSAATLAGAIWAYDMGLKNTQSGPLSMAACRTLNILLGASNGSYRSAAPAAAIAGVHTFALTTVSRQEVDGGSSDVPRRAQAATKVIAGCASALSIVDSLRAPTTDRAKGRVSKQHLLRLAISGAAIGTFAQPVLRAQQNAIDEPSAKNMGRVVGTSIQAMIPLQAGFLAARGRLVSAAAVASGWPLARSLSRKRAIT